MKLKILGKDLDVSEIGLGCMGFSHASGAPTEKAEALRAIGRSAEMGHSFFDTAECYTGVNADDSISYNFVMALLISVFNAIATGDAKFPMAAIFVDWIVKAAIFAPRYMSGRWTQFHAIGAR